MKFAYILFIALCLRQCVGLKAEGTNKPNIIVIIGDDIGWNDFGFHGSSQIPTPNIDALGYNGVFLNKFYTQAICSPSRAAFLTGKYPMRYGYQGAPLAAGEDRPIPDNIELLPAKLKKLGYKTHLVGKWHLSAARQKDTPTRRGFDTHFGYWNGFIGYFDHFSDQNMYNDWKLNETWSGLDFYDEFVPQWQYENQYATDLFTNKSLELINQHNISEPMFLYLGHLAAHTGANGTELGTPNITYAEEKYSYIENPQRRKFADIVNRLDDSVGQIVQKLYQKGMLNNSIILFFSDNGAQTIGTYENFGSNYPLKGLKFTLWEGGVRGSAVMYSSLLKKKKYINNHLMHITDLFATFLHVAGGEPELYDSHDGVNQWPSISNDLSSARSEILLNIDEVDGYSALISDSGRYKILNGTYKNGVYDGSLGDPGKSKYTPSYDHNAVINSFTNKAIESLGDTTPLTKEVITSIRSELDISACNGRVRAEDSPCYGVCLFDLWNDPCETEDIVNKKTLVASDLKAKLKQYLKQITPSRNAKTDLKADPHACNNTWYTWLDEGGCSSVERKLYF